MNTETGQVKELRDLTPEERKSGKWVEIPKELEEKVLALSEEERVLFAKQHESELHEGKKSVSTDRPEQFINKHRRNQRNKLARIARRRNR